MKRIAMALCGVLIATAVNAQQRVTQVDGTRVPKVYKVAVGTDLYLTTADLSGWSQIFGIMYITQAGVDSDSLGVHRRVNGSGWTTEAMMEDVAIEFSIDSKKLEDVAALPATSAKPDTVLWVGARNGEVQIMLYGS